MASCGCDSGICYLDIKLPQLKVWELMWGGREEGRDSLYGVSLKGHFRAYSEGKDSNREGWELEAGV